jgi:hypothetical protein
MCQRRIEMGTDHGILAGGAQREFYCRQRLRRHQCRWHLFQKRRRTRRSLAIIRAAIEALGGRIDQVVRTRMYVMDVSKWEEIAKVHGEVFAEIRPATAILQIAKLIDAEAQIEIEADAIVP